MIHDTATCVFSSLTLFCVLFESFGGFQNLYNLVHDLHNKCSNIRDLFRVLCAVSQ